MGDCSIRLVVKMLAVFAIALLASPLRVTADCYFATEMQGMYVFQTTDVMNKVDYQPVNITENSIPTWGLCHKRIGNNIVLWNVDNKGKSCYKCIHMNLVARNVLLIHTDYGVKCYPNEETAIAACPNDSMADEQSTQKEVILYKTLEYVRTATDDNMYVEIKRQYCPFNGRYRLMLTIDDGGPEPNGCDLNKSELDNCPSGSALNLRFRECERFHDYEATLECLGQWKGRDNQNFIAFMNTGNQSFGPPYRCATFVKDPDTHAITVSMSPDSQCSSHAYDERKEILELYPIKNDTFERHVHQYQRLPVWMQGEYEFLTIDDKEIVYRDQTSFKTYTMKNIAYYNTPAAAIDDLNSIRLLTFSQTNCGEKQYHCISVHKRSTNVLEFQIGSKTVHESSLNDNDASIDDYLGGLDKICSDQYFDEAHIMTQARLDSTFELSPCPIDGEFIGSIPDSEDLCARLWSDCEKNDTMNYQVTICGHDEVYDERVYQCIGQWTENNIIYTYARRLDVPTYECFLGALASTDEIFIKEAGEHCRRDIDPYRYSMQLNRTRACPKVEPKPNTHATHDFFDKEKPASVAAATPEETPPTNTEIDYDYIDDNHVNLNGNVISSTEPKVHVPEKENVDNHNAIDDRMNNELFHPIHPKLDVTNVGRDNKKTTHNRSSIQFNNFTVTFALLMLSMLLPNLSIY